MFRSGFTTILGLPNVGKSTLLNQIIGEKLSIVTDKPQTTRHRILGILNQKNSQLVFLDTPGIHESEKLLNEKIVETALETIREADVICHVVFPSLPLSPIDQKIAEKVKRINKPHVVIVNQVDKVQKEKLLPVIEAISVSWEPQEIIPISALKGEGVDRVVEILEKNLPEGPPYFPQDEFTQSSTRFLCQEIVREKAMKFLHQEIPYGLTALVEEFKEEENMVSINAAIIVDRANHKAMVIGAKGQKIKRIGTMAREDIEKLVGKKVFLELFVKVVKGWTSDPKRLEEYGI